MALLRESQKKRSSLVTLFSLLILAWGGYALYLFIHAVRPTQAGLYQYLPAIDAILLIIIGLGLLMLREISRISCLIFALYKCLYAVVTYYIYILNYNLIWSSKHFIMSSWEYILTMLVVVLFLTHPNVEEQFN